MSDIIRYQATVIKRTNVAPELAKELPSVLEHQLATVAARDVTVTPTVVSFHGRISRTATVRRRLVTNWNLLSIISRGAILIESDYPTVSITFWLGFPKLLLAVLALLIMGAMLFLATTVLVDGASLADTIFAVLFWGTAGFVWVGIVPIAITVVRFHWFVRTCIRKAEKALRNGNA